MKRFNLKMLFRDGKCFRLEAGDFGEIVENKPRVKAETVTQDSFIAWPVNPNFTGAYGILSMLQIPVADNIEIVNFE